MRPNITRIDPSELATLQEKIKFKATDFNKNQVLKGKIFKLKGMVLLHEVKADFSRLQGLMHCEKKEDEEPNAFQARFIEEFKRLFELQNDVLVQKADFTRREEANVDKIPAETEENFEEEQELKKIEELRRQADEISKHKTEQKSSIEIFRGEFSTKIDVEKFRRNLLERIKQTDLNQLQNKQQIAILFKALKILHTSQNQVLDLMALCDGLDAFKRTNPEQFSYDDTTSFITTYDATQRENTSKYQEKNKEFAQLTESQKIDSFIQDIQMIFNDILNASVEESNKTQLLELVGKYFGTADITTLLVWKGRKIAHATPCGGFKTIKLQQKPYGIAWSEGVESIKTDILSLHRDYKAVSEEIAGVESGNFGFLLDSEKIKKTDRKIFFKSLGEYLGDDRFKIIKDKIEESAKASNPVLTDDDIPTIRTLIIEAFGGELKGFIQGINSSDNGENLADLLGIDLDLVRELQDSIQDKSTIEDFTRFKDEQKLKEQEIKRKIVGFRNNMNIHRKFSDAVAVNTSETVDSVLSRYVAADSISINKDYNSELEKIVLGSMEAVRDVDGTHQVESDDDKLLIESAIKTLEGIINPISTTSNQPSKTVKIKKLSDEEKQELSRIKDKQKQSQEVIGEVKNLCAGRRDEFREAVTLKKQELENLKESREALRASWGIGDVEEKMLRYMEGVRQNISTLHELKAKINQLVLDKAKKEKEGIASDVDKEEAQKVKGIIESIISGERVDLNEDILRKKVATTSASSQIDITGPTNVVRQTESFRVGNSNDVVPQSSILPTGHHKIEEEVLEFPAVSVIEKINAASNEQGSVEKYEELGNPFSNPLKSAVVQEDEIRIINTESRELKLEKLSLGTNTARLMNERKFTITSVNKPINSDQTGNTFSKVLFHLIDEAAKSAKVFKKDSKKIDYEIVAKIIIIAGASGGVSGDKSKSKFEKNFREVFPQSDQSGKNLLLDKAKRFSYKFQELSKNHALYTGSDLSDEKTKIVGARLKRISPEMVTKYCAEKGISFDKPQLANGLLR